MEEAVGELQTRLTAVQAALEGNLQSGLFQLRSFNGLPNEDINEWLSRFETLAKFHTWSNAKKFRGANAKFFQRVCVQRTEFFPRRTDCPKQILLPKRHDLMKIQLK